MISSPYQTDCFDYQKIGFKSRSQCIDKCNIESSIKQCNCLPEETKVDRHNDKDDYQCIPKCNFSYSICEQKHKKPDCFNEYYSFRTVIDVKLDENPQIRTSYLNATNKKINNINNISLIVISYDDEPDTIYNHTPQQEIVEFIGFFCGVISLWTGFSIFSMYTFSRKAFIRSKKTFKLNTINKNL